jgi:hypothetical protein
MDDGETIPEHIFKVLQYLHNNNFLQWLELKITKSNGLL